MRAAIAAARGGVMRGEGGPFGACIVRGGAVLATASNCVLAHHDPTAHAEVTAIRAACAQLQTHLLAGAHVYTTTEPCPMCFAALNWARVSRIYYGTNIADVAALGFNELTISNYQMKEIGGSAIEIIPDFLRPECLDLLQLWRASQSQQTY